MWVLAAKAFNEPTAVREQFSLWAVFLFNAAAADKKNNLGKYLRHERKQATSNLPMSLFTLCVAWNYTESNHKGSRWLKKTFVGL